MDMDKLPRINPQNIGDNVPRRNDPAIAKYAQKFLDLTG